MLPIRTCVILLQLKLCNITTCSETLTIVKICLLSIMLTFKLQMEIYRT